MSLSTLRTRVKGNVGNRSDKDTIIDSILNFVIDDLARKYRWADMEDMDYSVTLSQGTYEISLPSTVRLVDLVRLKDSNSNWYDIDAKTRRVFRAEYSESVPSTTRTPEACYIQGRKLKFSDVADKDYTVYMDVVKYATVMSLEDDEPCILGIDNLVATLATGHLYMHLKQPEQAEVWFGLAESFMESQKDEVVGNPIGMVEG